MNSPFSTLYLNIKDRLEAEVPELRWIDMEMGQLEQERPTTSFPCLLIDFDDWKYEDQGENIQFAEGVVNLRIGFAAWSNTNNKTPTYWQEKGLSHYDLEWKIYKALQGWKPEKYGYLLRISVNTEQREDNLRVRLMRFSCEYEDYEASPVYETTPLPPLHFE